MSKNHRKRHKAKRRNKSNYLVHAAWILFFALLIYITWPLLKTVYFSTAVEESRFGIKRYADLEIPKLLIGKTEQIIRYEGYTVSYNRDWHIPNWVAYELIPGELRGNEPRHTKFSVDYRVKGNSATNADYAHSGYDKGHMAPAGDMKWGKKAMQESFYFTNICPQHPGLNRGMWKDLEEKIRDWSREDSCVLIVCGPLVGKNDKTIGRNSVKVPHAFFKVVMIPYTQQPKGIGFIFKNNKEEGDLSAYAVSVDSVETLTGIDFFTRLPDDIEDVLESSDDIKKWSF